MKYQTLILVLAMILLTGCGQSKQQNISDSQDKSGQTETLDENVTVVLPELLTPEASGVEVEENEQAVIDYSNVADGYVMVKYKTETSNRLKAQVKGPTTTYTYNLTVDEWEVFPFSDGNGEYQVTVFENVEKSKYATVLSSEFSVTLKDEYAPFLRPNQYVNYSDAPKTVEKAAYLTAGKTTELEKVQAIYEYVIQNISYDKELAESVKSGYLPVLDDVLDKKKGICFDYASLMTAMLRSQSVPCKLVVGYAGETYHAWISVYTQADGWINNVIYFDGTTWQRMDPTFASSGNQSDEILEYIGDGANYTEKYLY